MHESEKWKGSRSVVSDSLQPPGLQPTRLLRPWDFPGRSTGVGCHCLLPKFNFFFFSFRATSHSRHGFPGGSVGNLSAMQETQETWVQVGKIPLRRAWQPTLVFLPGESLGQRSLVGYSPWGHKSQTQLKRLSTYTNMHARTADIWDPSSPSRDWTRAPCIKNAVLTTTTRQLPGPGLNPGSTSYVTLGKSLNPSGPQSHLWDKDNNIYHKRSTKNVMSSCAWKYLGWCLACRKYPASISYYYLSFKMKIALWNYRLWE